MTLLMEAVLWGRPRVGTGSVPLICLEGGADSN